ncbi:methyltransferase [Phenylobacterium sp.]|uniref:methyltransferase n=1 Tax=Phenylobacterium sp. TaxID=1871053 RepID=UPI0025DCB2C9|nr:methyltransferase [Phenylobacterium sp.]
MSAETAGAADDALLSLLGALEALGYDFVTPLNSTLRTVRSRREVARAGNLRDVLGWSLPFSPGSLGSEIEDLLLAADAVRDAGAQRRVTIRVSRVEGALFLHSAYPPGENGGVFLGPDSYRFARFTRSQLHGGQVRRVCDMGAGAGVGGITAAKALGEFEELRLTDVNPTALRFARINAVHAGVAATPLQASGAGADDASFDLILANPPFIADSQRPYSDGGDELGIELSVAWAAQAMERLIPGGRLLLYTGAPVVDGEDRLRAKLEYETAGRDCRLEYEEIDPDIFGGELRRPAYATVERIAAIGAVVTRA